MSPTPPTLEPTRWDPMPSVRMMLRRFVVAELKDHTLAGCRVYSNRATPVDTPDLPAIFVQVKDEPSSIFQDAPRAYRRELTLWLDIYAESTTATPDPSDLVDMIAAQLEVRMAIIQHEINQAAVREGDSSPWALMPNASGLRGTSMDVDDAGRALEAGARITWVLTYLLEIDEAQLLAQKITPLQIVTVAWDFDADGAADTEDHLHPAQD